MTVNFYSIVKAGARTLVTALAFVLTVFSAAAQKQVGGTVKDAGGEPLPGVMVTVPGTGTGTVTSTSGAYSVNVPEGSTQLRFSFIGFEDVTENIGSRTVIDVVMRESAAQLDEVVAVGYGVQRRRDLTGAVSSVNSGVLEAMPVATATEAITGRMAGVQVVTSEGGPDAEIRITVRGGGSITQDNSPLYIVDGFPVTSINDIAPGDIETIDVLKDASSTAVYGARGANGVIIVTTKSGLAGRVTVNYNAYVGWKKIANTLDVLSPSDYVHWQYERALLADDVSSHFTPFFGNFQDIDLYDGVASNDWQRQVFGRTGNTFNHNLSISGGGEKTTYLVNYAHVYDKAIMQLSNYKRDNASIKFNSKPNKRVSLDFSTRYSRTEIRGGGANEQNEKSSSDSRLRNAIIYPPIPVTGLTDDGDDDANFSLYHPLVNISDNDRLQKRTNLNLSGAATWEAIDNLKLKTEIGYDNIVNNDDRFYGRTTYYSRNNSGGLPAIVFREMNREKIRNTNTVSYDFKGLFCDPAAHRLSVLVGQEALLTQEVNRTATVHRLPGSFDFFRARSLSTEGTPYEVKNYMEMDDALLSFFGRANYEYKGRYLFTTTFRADGSSRFARANRWGYFPSAAVAWRITEEPFMENTRSWLDDMKIRLSFGSAGNNNIPLGVINQEYESLTTQWINGISSYYAPTKIMANPDLKWETTITRNFGIDYSLLRGRVNGTIDLYQNTTNDLLIAYGVAGSGYDIQYQNLGDTRNRGIEFSVNWLAVDIKNFSLNVSGNINFNRGKITDLGAKGNFGETSKWASTEIGNDFLVMVGHPVGIMYGYRTDGRYEVDDFEDPALNSGRWVLKQGVTDGSAPLGGASYLRPGSLKLRDLSGDGIVKTNGDDQEIIGNANPKHTGGLILNIKVYNFDFGANFNWSYGNDVYNANKIEYTSTSKYHSRNMITEMASGNRWTNLRADGTISNDPAELASMNTYTTMWSPYMQRFILHDWAVEDGSFLRLSTLTLGYTLPQSVTRRLMMQNLRVYVSSYNVFCWTKYSGFDPEVSTRRNTPLTPGVDYSAYPRSRSLIVGANLTF